MPEENTESTFSQKVKENLLNLSRNIKEHKFLAGMIAVLVILLLGTGVYAFVETVIIKEEKDEGPTIPQAEEENVEETVVVFEYFCPEDAYIEDGKKYAEDKGEKWELNEQQSTWIEFHCEDFEWMEKEAEEIAEEPPAPAPTPAPTPEPTTPQAEPEPEPEPAPESEPEPEPEPAPEEEEAEVLPVLKNLMVNFAPYSATTGKAGDFIFDLAQDKVFLEYGAVVEGPGGPKTLPTFEYRTDVNAQVFAAADGYVQMVSFQSDTGDYEIHTTPTETSQYTVSYDHVKNVTVSEGDTVVAGQVLGKVGTWDETMGRTELMIFGPFGEGGAAITFCPFTFFDPTLLATYKAKVQQLMNDWEAFKGDDTIYDGANAYTTGCRAETLGG